MGNCNIGNDNFFGVSSNMLPGVKLINDNVIGANATIICGTDLGEYCFVGSGAVVTKDIPGNALVVGNPSKIIGWVGESGEKLEINEKILVNYLGFDLKKVDEYIKLTFVNFISNFQSSDLDKVFIKINQKSILGLEMQRKIRKENGGEIPKDLLNT